MKKGFTLVELVITIAIVIILSVISVPIYRGYVDKAKMSEGYSLLGLILSAQKSYYSEYGNFYVSSGSNMWTNNDTVLGIDARSNKYFTRFYSAGSNEGCITMCKSAARIPDELVKDGKSGLRLWYNITEGYLFEEVKVF